MDAGQSRARIRPAAAERLLETTSQWVEGLQQKALKVPVGSPRFGEYWW